MLISTPKKATTITMKQPAIAETLLIAKIGDSIVNPFTRSVKLRRSRIEKVERAIVSMKKKNSGEKMNDTVEGISSGDQKRDAIVLEVRRRITRKDGKLRPPLSRKKKRNEFPNQTETQVISLETGYRHLVTITDLSATSEN